MNTRVILCILDGFGFTDCDEENNATLQMKNFWKIFHNNKHLLLSASGNAVGLPNGQVGNSEVGHTTIGIGAVKKQNLVKINDSISSGEFFTKSVYLKILESCGVKINQENSESNIYEYNNYNLNNSDILKMYKKEKFSSIKNKNYNNDVNYKVTNNYFGNDNFDNELSLEKRKCCNLIGLISDGGVHSHKDHIIKIAENLSSHKIKVFIHAILDGRDSPQKSGFRFIKEIVDLKNENIVIKSVCGRFFGMDRDKRWERTSLAYDLIIRDKSNYKFKSALKTIEYFYKDGIFDEFIPPSLIVEDEEMQIFDDFNYDFEKKRENKILIDNNENNKENFLICNFREDRMRQLTSALVSKNFEHFERFHNLNEINVFTLTSYDDSFLNLVNVFFQNEQKYKSLPDIIAENNLSQLHVAETEKYAHVTFFLNGGKENENKNESRIFVPSPKVETYDLSPEMSASEITEKLIVEVKKKKYDFIVVNYANLDMLGHTGNLTKTMESAIFLDKCLMELIEASEEANYVIMITADHGNAEEMFNHKLCIPNTSHTNNKVPLLILNLKENFHKINENFQLNENVDLNYEFGLRDIAPTILEILELNKPESMSGKSLLKYFY